MLSLIANLIGRRRARNQPSDETVYFGRLKYLSDNEWRAAIEESPVKAARWVEAAATYGNVDAQLYWAQMLLDGYGTARDPERAFRWFAIAAESKRADAINMVGRCHERGWGVPIDFAKAAEFYRMAAEKFDNWARFNLACLLMEGRGVTPDPSTAFALFAKAAEEEHVKSFFKIGLFHEHGWGRPRDRSLALHWYRRSAAAGDFRGQYQYGRMLLEDETRGEALEWINRCISDSPAEFCRDIAPELLAHADEDLRIAGIRAARKGKSCGALQN